MEEDQHINMLHILIGPSGVGKTTIIKELMYNYSWNPVITYCTRKTRVDDINKIHIAYDSFEKLKKVNFFHSIQSVHDNHYGQPKNQIACALESKANWIFDISHEYIESFQNIDCNFHVVLCENEESLINQLKKAGRPNRIDEAIKQHRKLSKLVKNSNFTYRLIINKQGEVGETISKLIK